MASYVKFVRGSLAAYNNLTTKDNDTLYFLNEGWLYLGNKLISKPGIGEIKETLKLTDLQDVLIKEGIDCDSLLMYRPDSNGGEGSWEAFSFDDLTFQKATNNSDGLSGLVPAPKAGEQDYFLSGDGTWKPAAASSQVFQVEPGASEDHLTAIARVTSGKPLSGSDIAIVKDFIAKDKNEISKYAYTAYVYDKKSLRWEAMDGNYNAENVYFKNNLIFTENVGSIAIPASGSIEVATQGKNIKEVMEYIFSKEKNPNIVMPSVVLNVPESGEYEVGTKIIPTYSVELDPGSYEFGPDTGVAAISYSVTATDVIDPLTTQEGQFEEIEIGDSTQYYITATITHTTGNQPKTNLNNIYEEGQIAAGSVYTTSAVISGYRPFYYGVDTTGGVLNSALIKTLINGGIYDDQKIITFDASKHNGAKRFIIAIPSSSTRRGIVSARIISSMYADVMAEYKKMQYGLTIGGVNNYNPTAYDVWVYEPASIASNEVHEIILS